MEHCSIFYQFLFFILTINCLANVNSRQLELAINKAKLDLIHNRLRWLKTVSSTFQDLNFDVSWLKLGMVLAGHSVAMVTYSVTKIIPTCSLVIGQFFDTLIVASIDKEWL